MDERPSTPSSGRDADRARDTDLARRRLLRLGAYAAPAVVGKLMLSGTVLAQSASCNPQTCFPNGGPCGPDDCPPRS